MKVQKQENTIYFETGVKVIAFPYGSFVAVADADSVNIKTKASRRTILSFPYTEMIPSQASAEEAVEYIANL